MQNGLQCAALTQTVSSPSSGSERPCSTVTPRVGGIPLRLFVLTGRSSVETVRRAGLVTRDGRNSAGRRSVGIVRLDWAAFVGTKESMG